MLPFTDNGRLDTSLAFVFGHSFGMSRREWIEVAALLGETYRTITLDNPGFGDAHDISGYSVAEMVQHYADTLSTLDLDRYVLVGHSMSGKIAAILAANAHNYGIPGPNRLVLLTPTPLGPEPLSEENRHQLISMERNRATAEAFVRSHSHIPLKPALQERAIEDVLRVNQNAWEAWLARGTREDWTAKAAPITTKTLVICAENDPEWGPEAQKRLTMPYLTDAELVTIAESGHLVPMEDPSTLFRTLRGFAEG